MNEQEKPEIDYKTIEYFHFEKGDATRFCGWDLAAITLNCPELAYAYEQMEMSRKIFEAVLRDRAR